MRKTIAALALLWMPQTKAFAATWENSLIEISRSLQSGSEALRDIQQERGRTLTPATGDGCSADVLEVASKDPQDVLMACAGFHRAVAFLASFGYAPRAKVRVIFTETFPERFVRMGITPERVHGFVDPDTLDIYMAPFKRFMELPAQSTLFEIGPSEELFRSYLAHEMLHILSAQTGQDASQRMPKVLSEYIAYSGQLATMAEPLRSEILKRFALKKWEPFAGPQDIRLDYHDMNHRGFAVKSYLYSLTPEGLEYLRGSLAGTVRATPSMELE